MLLNDIRIQKDNIGYFYLRKHNKNITKERGFMSICMTCKINIFIHNKDCLKEKHFCSHKCQPIWNKNKIYNEEEKGRLNLSGLEKGRAWNKGKKGISEKTKKLIQ